MATTTTVAGGKGKVASKGNKVAKRATKGAKAKSGDKPATALDRIGDATANSGLKTIAVPSHLRSKVGKPDGETFGKSTGLRVVHFADALLRANDKVKATDAELSIRFRDEFPKRHTAASGVQGQKTLQTIAAFRGYHNAGKHGCGDGVHHSRSYNAEGVARTAPSAKPKAKAKKAKK